MAIPQTIVLHPVQKLIIEITQLQRFGVTKL